MPTERSSSLVSEGAVLLLTDGARRLIVSPLDAHTDIERVFSDRATRPDETWSYTDPNGHTHTYVRDADGVPRLPSLIRGTKHIDCDGSCFEITHGDCDGFDVDEWTCRECGAVVEPRFKPDIEARSVGIPIVATTTYSLTAEFPPPKAKRSWRRPRTKTITIRASDPPLVGPIEGAEIAWTDPDGVEQRHPMPTLVAGNVDFDPSPDGLVMRVELHGEEMHSIERKPTGP